MNEEQNKWLTIIPPMPEEEFETFLKRWREANQPLLLEMSPERFVVDVLRAEGGKTHRRLRMKLS